MTWSDPEGRSRERPGVLPPCVRFLQARDIKIVSHRIYWDNATFMAQLGVMPGA